jgi:GntR family transcriptional regulator
MSSGEQLTRPILYLQIAEVLAERIAGGTWRPGSAIPNEGDLAREFGVSAGTMRKALDKLEADRIIARQQGRGTFVLDQSADKLAFRFSRIVDQQGQRAGDRDAVLLSQEMARANLSERAHLGLAAGDEVVRTVRLRSHKGRPSRHETTCLARDRLGIRSAEDVGDYLIVPLAQACGVHLGRGTEKITAVSAPADVADLLGVRAGKMLLRLDRVICAADGKPVEWRIALCDLRDEYYLAEMQ